MRTALFIMMISLSHNSHAQTWTYKSYSDPVTDVIVESITAESITGSNKFGQNIEAMFICAYGNIELLVDFKSYFNGNSAEIMIRYDSHPAERRRMMLDGQTRLKTGSQAAGQIMTEIYYSDRVIMRATPFRDNSITATFDTDGFKEAFHQLSSRCKSSTTIQTGEE